MVEYETGIRLDLLEAAVRELQEEVFPEKFKKKPEEEETEEPEEEKPKKGKKAKF
jgi:hypothetical protein